MFSDRTVILYTFSLNDKHNADYGLEINTHSHIITNSFVISFIKVEARVNFNRTVLFILDTWNVGSITSKLIEFNWMNQITRRFSCRYCVAKKMLHE